MYFSRFISGMISSSWSSSSSGASSMLSAAFATPGVISTPASASLASSSLLSSSSSTHLNNYSPTPSSSDDGIESDAGCVDPNWQDNSSSSSIEPRKKRTRIIFKCTWPGCECTKEACFDIEAHVRSVHLADQDVGENEEEFYYTEVEVPDLASPALQPPQTPSLGGSSLPPSFTITPTISFNQTLQSPQLGHMSQPALNLSSMAFSPTLSHLDMVRPPSEGTVTRKYL